MRKPLLINQRGKVSFITDPHGRVIAACRIRDTDDVIRRVRGAAGRTQREAERNLNVALANRPDRRPKDSSESVAAVSRAWFDVEDKFANWSIGTRIQYLSVLDGIIIPMIGDKEIGKITTPMVNALFESVGARTPGRVKVTRTVLNQTMKYAVGTGQIPFNPVRDSTARTLRTSSGSLDVVRALSADELQSVRAAADAHDRGEFRTRGPRPTVPTRVLIELGLALAARIGEVLALRWVDIEGLHCGGEVTVTIRGTIVPARVRDEGASYVYQPYPKNRRVRAVKVDSNTAELLRSLPVRGDYVIASAVGGFITQSNAGERLRAVFAYAGVDATFHSLRRTVATVVERMHGLDAAAAAIGDSSRAVAQKHYVARAIEVPDFRGALATFDPER